MNTAFLRVTLAPFVAAALFAFAIALLIEWLGDLARSCPHTEKTR